MLRKCDLITVDSIRYRNALDIALNHLGAEAPLTTRLQRLLDGDAVDQAESESGSKPVEEEKKGTIRELPTGTHHNDDWSCVEQGSGKPP